MGLRVETQKIFSPFPEKLDKGRRYPDPKNPDWRRFWQNYLQRGFLVSFLPKKPSPRRGAWCTSTRLRRPLFGQKPQGPEGASTVIPSEFRGLRGLGAYGAHFLAKRPMFYPPGFWPKSVHRTHLLTKNPEIRRGPFGAPN